MRFVNVYEGEIVKPMAAEYLYGLLKERSSEPSINISHQEMPSFAQHLAFIERRPYRFWYLLQPDTGPAAGNWVGTISASTHNEIGVGIARAHRNHGYGRVAIAAFVEKFRPLPEVPSARVGRWIANINPANAHSKHVFTQLGFELKQETYVLRGGEDG